MGRNGTARTYARQKSETGLRSSADAVGVDQAFLDKANKEIGSREKEGGIRSMSRNNRSGRRRKNDKNEGDGSKTRDRRIKHAARKR